MLFYLLIFTASFLITWIVRKIAIRKSILDHPNERSSHSVPTPRGGGLAIAIVWFGGLVFFYLTKRIDESLFYALLCGLPLPLIGLADDIFTLKPGIRFLVQFACTVSALWFLGGLQHCELSFSSFQFPVILTPVAFIAIIWAINLFNFLDGIDGYISTEVIFIGISLFLLAGSSLGILLTASVAGFLIWNWPKAKIFMGDVGSTLLGFIVAVMAIYNQNNYISSICVSLILTSVFWFDATVTLIRRFFNKEKLTEAHRKHAYQRAVQSGFSHQQTTVSSIFLNLIGFGFAWLAHRFNSYAILFLVSDLLVLFLVLKFIDKRKPFEYTNKL